MKFWRINLVLILIFILGAAVIGRLFIVQIQEHDIHKAMALGQQNVFVDVEGERGGVFIQDKKGNLYPLAVDQKTEEGIKRYYPQKNSLSQVIGFLGGEDIGQYGLEGYYEDVLKGEKKLQERERNPWISFFSTKKTAPQDGLDLILSIDYNIQFQAEKLLKQAKENLNIEGGQIIVMDPNDGRIIAMANFPNFDPNKYFQEENFEIFKNSTTQKIFEPGSVFKPITIAAALDQGKITPQSTYIDKGTVTISGHTISNYDNRVYGETSMTGVLERSINTGAVFAESTLDHDVFVKYIEKFGFFEPTGIDLQEEAYSINKEFKKGYEINYATAAFGQGIEITPIQLITAYSAIANGGNLIKPHMVEKKRNKTNEISEVPIEIIKKGVISSKTASQLTAMLVSVTENGFGKKARVPGYYIAGKTGTAQISFASLGINKEGYSKKTWQSFVGFGPAFSPQFVILVKLDNPETNTAEYSAIPVFQKLAKYIIDYWEILPDKE